MGHVENKKIVYKMNPDGDFTIKCEIISENPMIVIDPDGFMHELKYYKETPDECY